MTSTRDSARQETRNYKRVVLRTHRRLRYYLRDRYYQAESAVE